MNVIDRRKSVKLQHKVISHWQENWKEKYKLVLDWSTILCVSPGITELLYHAFLTVISCFLIPRCTLTLNYWVLLKLEKLNKIYSLKEHVFTSTKEREIFGKHGLVPITLSFVIKQLLHHMSGFRGSSHIQMSTLISKGLQICSIQGPSEFIS